MTLDMRETVTRLGLALAIGLLIGMERGWHDRALPEGRRIAGVRTFGLIGLLGGISGTLAGAFADLVTAAGLVAVATAFAIAQLHDPRRDTDVGITTNIAALVAFGLGALAATGSMLAAAVAGVVTMLLLGIKPELHRLLEKIERRELLATIRLLLISVVVLPVLPDRGFGPWEAVNPYRLWWMVVLVAGISYVGYFINRIIGARRGILVTGVLGGLVSSTATVLSLSRQARDQSVPAGITVSGMLAATAIMFPRILVIAVVIAPGLARTLAAPLLLAAAIAGAAAAAFALFSRRRDDATPAVSGPANPLDLRTAIQFALVLAPVMILARFLHARAGDTGLYLLATVSGMVDVDAITLALATMAADTDAMAALVTEAILLASIVNTLIKPAIAFAVAGRTIGFRVLPPLLVVVSAMALYVLIAERFG